MSAFLELAERCEKATGPDRELDVAIARAVDWAPHGKAFTASAFTSSLDAAMTLVPEGRWWVCDSKGRASIFYERGDLAGEAHTARSSAATPALALCAAALRARAAS